MSPNSCTNPTVVSAQGIWHKLQNSAGQKPQFCAGMSLLLPIHRRSTDRTSMAVGQRDLITWSPTHSQVTLRLLPSVRGQHYAVRNIRYLKCLKSCCHENSIDTDLLVWLFKRVSASFLACLTPNITNRAHISSLQSLQNWHIRKAKKWLGKWMKKAQYTIFFLFCHKRQIYWALWIIVCNKTPHRNNFVVV